MVRRLPAHDAFRNDRTAMDDAAQPVDIPNEEDNEAIADATTSIDATQTPEQLAEAKEYGRITLNLALFDMALDFVFLTTFALLAAQPLDVWLQGYSPLQGDQLITLLLRLSLFLLIYIALHAAVSCGLSYYRGYVIEHRYDLSNQSRLRWLTQYAKRISLTTVANLIMIGGLYGIIWLTGDWWWAVAAGTAFVVAILIGYIAPVLILPLFVKYEPLDDDELQAELSKLAEGTGLTIEGTYRLLLSADTKKANAMLAGLGRTRRVLLGDTLLENFSTDEIKVVMAHEIGHHVFGHIYKMLVMSIPYTLISFFACHVALGWWLGDAYDPSNAPVPVYAVAFLLLFLFVLGTITGPLQNAMMRHFERQCDRYALERTQSPEAYRGAFSKLAKLNKADPDPHWLEVFLFDDHPPIAERLAMADESR
jgi:STE24 endopeptidase